MPDRLAQIVEVPLVPQVYGVIPVSAQPELSTVAGKTPRGTRIDHGVQDRRVERSETLEQMLKRPPVGRSLPAPGGRQDDGISPAATRLNMERV